MNILNKSRENFTVKELYDLTKSPEIMKMSTIAPAETELEIVDYIIYEDINAKGETQTIVCVKTADGELYATNSPTFTREFKDVVDMCESVGEQLHKIKPIEGTSKNGRKYITCVYLG